MKFLGNNESDQERQPILEREQLRNQANQAELVERIVRAVQKDGVYQVLPGLYFHRESKLTQPHHGVSDPAFCVIAQGNKEVHLGDNVYRYDPAHYLLATVELPITSEVIEASEEHPYLSLRMQLDPDLVRVRLAIERGQTPVETSRKPTISNQIHV